MEYSVENYIRLWVIEWVVLIRELFHVVIRVLVRVFYSLCVIFIVPNCNHIYKWCAFSLLLARSLFLSVLVSIPFLVSRRHSLTHIKSIKYLLRWLLVILVDWYSAKYSTHFHSKSNQQTQINFSCFQF